MVAETATQANSAFTTFGVGFVSLATVLFIWYRRLKLDRKEDVANQKILDEFSKAAEMWRLHAEDLKKSLDKSTEREYAAIKEASEYASKFGELEATLKHMQSAFEKSERENAELRQQVKLLTERLDKFIDDGVTV